MSAYRLRGGDWVCADGFTQPRKSPPVQLHPRSRESAYREWLVGKLNRCDRANHAGFLRDEREKLIERMDVLAEVYFEHRALELADGDPNAVIRGDREKWPLKGAATDANSWLHSPKDDPVWFFNRYLGRKFFFLTPMGRLRKWARQLCEGIQK